MSKKYLNFDELQKREKLKLSTKSKLIRKTINNNPQYIRGRAISVIGKTVQVELDTNDKIVYECIVSGRINSPHIRANIVCVGDYVKFLVDEANEHILSGRIIEIEERIRKFSRKLPGKNYSEHVIAANIDYVVFFLSAFDPAYNKKLIDRLLIGAEIGLVKPIICINKIDLASSTKEIAKDLEVYDKLNIPTFLISVNQNKGIKPLKKMIQDKTTLIFGPSGVGKSSFINLILKNDLQKVSEVSEKTGKGLHTTSFVKLIHCEKNTTIIDSPGIREFGLWDMDKLNLCFHFHDFDKYYPECKFKPCTHIHEPNCAVINAVENGEIDLERYQSYINIYETIDDDIYF